MRYSGSKAKIAKYIIPFIMKELKPGNAYIEPFVGGCNVMDKVDWDWKIGWDLNNYVISMWCWIKSVNCNSFPKHISEEDYYKMKELAKRGKYDANKYPCPLIGYVGNACSYGSAWFNGYAHYNKKKNEDHILEAWNGLTKQVANFKNLKNTCFCTGSYEDALNIANLYTNVGKQGCVVYCDPPYKNTKGYGVEGFCHEKFWDLVRHYSKLGVKIFVSEYEAPDDFKCVWSMERKDGMSTTKTGVKQKTKVEKLFVYGG
jgi:DNA adenine methylase